MQEEEKAIQTMLNFYRTSLSDEFNKLTLPLAQYYGFDAVGYLWISPTGESFDISNKPALQEFYFSKQIYKVDPFKRHPDNFFAGAYLPASANVTILKSYINEMAHPNGDMNISEGIAICKKREDGVHFFALATSDVQLPALGIAINNLNVFDKFCDYLLAKWQPLVHKMEPFTINMTSLVGEEVFYKKKQELYFGTEPERKSEFLKSIGIHEKRALEFYDLTKREKECVELIVQGISVKQIAKSLHISPHTVEVHIKHIKRRLGCSSRIDILNKINYLKLLGLY